MPMQAWQTGTVGRNLPTQTRCMLQPGRYQRLKEGARGGPRAQRSRREAARRTTSAARAPCHRPGHAAPAGTQGGPRASSSGARQCPATRAPRSSGASPGTSTVTCGRHAPCPSQLLTFGKVSRHDMLKQLP